MPNLANAKKALRQSKRHAEHNKIVHSEIKSLKTHIRKALADNKLEDAQKLIRDLTKKIDKAAGRGIIKKNTAARVKSRTMKKINATKK